MFQSSHHNQIVTVNEMKRSRESGSIFKNSKCAVGLCSATAVRVLYRSHFPFKARGMRDTLANGVHGEASFSRGAAQCSKAGAIGLLCPCRDCLLIEHRKRHDLRDPPPRFPPPPVAPPSPGPASTPQFLS